VGRGQLECSPVNLPPTDTTNTPNEHA
jgi:hypothetical protein